MGIGRRGIFGIRDLSWRLVYGTDLVGAVEATKARKSDFVNF
jgi:hypothetical protein